MDGRGQRGGPCSSPGAAGMRLVAPPSKLSSVASSVGGANQVPRDLVPSPLGNTLPLGPSALANFHHYSERKMFTIVCCGQNLQFELDLATSTESIKQFLRTTLSMSGQDFELFDVQGAYLVTDVDLVNAVAERRTPLSAALSDASIHMIENRREELSQMAWKLMRDRVGQLSDTVNGMSRKMKEMLDDQERHKQEMQNFSNRLRHEVCGICDNNKDIAHQDVRTISERMDAVAHIIHSERNAREAIKQSLEQQIQGIRDALETDRSMRRSELANSASLVEECRASLDQEGRERQAFETRNIYDINKLSDRIEVLSRAQSDKAQDLSEQIKYMTRPVMKELEEQNRQVLQFRSQTEMNQVEAAATIKKLEDVTRGTESRILEVDDRHRTWETELWNKFQKLVENIEQVRVDERGTGMVVNSIEGRVEQMEARQKDMENHVVAPNPSTHATMARSSRHSSSQPLLAIEGQPHPLHPPGGSISMASAASVRAGSVVSVPPGPFVAPPKPPGGSCVAGPLPTAAVQGRPSSYTPTGSAVVASGSVVMASPMARPSVMVTSPGGSMVRPNGSCVAASPGAGGMLQQPCLMVGQR